ILNTSSFWSSISRCCAVTMTTWGRPRRSSSLTTGAIFIASGRVPKTTAIFIRVSCRETEKVDDSAHKQFANGGYRARGSGIDGREAEADMIRTDQVEFLFFD